MMSRLGRLLVLLMVASLALGACTQGGASPSAAAPEASEPTGCTAGAASGTQIPEVVDRKFNVAMVLIGPHDDGGWSQAHYEGARLARQFLMQRGPIRHSPRRAVPDWTVLHQGGTAIGQVRMFGTEVAPP